MKLKTNLFVTFCSRSPNGVVHCPQDGKEIVEGAVFYDKFCERDILQLECLCPNSEKGCNWKGEFVSLKVRQCS